MDHLRSFESPFSGENPSGLRARFARSSFVCVRPLFVSLLSAKLGYNPLTLEMGWSVYDRCNGPSYGVLSWGESPRYPELASLAPSYDVFFGVWGFITKSIAPETSSYEVPSEASPGGRGVSPEEKNVIRSPERSEPGGSRGFPPRKRTSYEVPSEASPEGLGDFRFCTHIYHQPASFSAGKKRTYWSFCNVKAGKSNVSNASSIAFMRFSSVFHICSVINRGCSDKSLTIYSSKQYFHSRSLASQSVTIPSAMGRPPSPKSNPRPIGPLVDYDGGYFVWTLVRVHHIISIYNPPP
jgi:hypothetical protein